MLFICFSFFGVGGVRILGGEGKVTHVVIRELTHHPQKKVTSRIGSRGVKTPLLMWPVLKAEYDFSAAEIF